MKRTVPFILALAFVTPAFVCGAEESLRFGRFGTVTAYSTSPHPSQVVLFVSGDGGWNLGVVDMARTLATLDALVVGVDIVRYLKELETSSEKCSYPAADFELLSKFVQKKFAFPIYIPPILVGYSSGATLVYATLVQAPPNTFRGALSLGFCPDLPLTKPFCHGNGLEWQPGPKGKGYQFLPAVNLEVPWIAFQGTVDQVCNAAATEAYVKQVRNGEMVLLPKVGHGFSVQKNWMPQFKHTFAQLVERQPIDLPPNVEELKDLPLNEVPAKKTGPHSLALIITGDGGWGVTDRGIANALADQGIPAVGLNSLQYFWTRRTPEGSARDLERILRHYLAVWKKEKAILIGYSLGADVLPFMLNRLSPDLRNRVELVALLGPSRSVDFEFHLADWLGNFSRKNALPVLPEVEKLRGTKILCFYGKEEKDPLCTNLALDLAKVIPLEGGHRLGGNYEPVANTILKEIK